MIRIGAVNLDTSHPHTFTKRLAETDRAKYTAVFNDGFRGDDEVEAFMKMNNIEKRYTDLDEMARNVDIAFIHDCNWEKHLAHAEPFIKAGTPVFIDKPIVGNMADLKKLKEYAESGAVILGSSSVRYANEIRDYLAIPKENRGDLVNVYGSCGVDEFNYGIHIVEGFGGLIDSDAVSCRYTATGENGGKRCDNFIIRYSNGITASYSLFIGTWHPFSLTIMATKGTTVMKLDSQALYQALLDRIFDTMETGVSTLAPFHKLEESVKIMLAGRISKENGGREILLSHIPEDDPGYDGYEFEKGYSAAAAKIYKL